MASSICPPDFGMSGAHLLHIRGRWAFVHIDDTFVRKARASGSFLSIDVQSPPIPCLHRLDRSCRNISLSVCLRRGQGPAEWPPRAATPGLDSIHSIRGFNMETKSFDLHAEFGTYVTVVRIEVREQALSGLRRFYGDEDMKGPMKLGKHDYIIFTAIDRNHRPFRFVAEKIKNWTRCGGMPSHIHMVPLSEYSSAALPSRSRFVWELHNHWIVSTTELNTILTTTGHHYNLFSANCWSYAANTVENMLGLCLCHSLLMRDFKAGQRCMEALEQLETVKRPLPRDVYRLFSEPLSRLSENFDTSRRIANWCNRRSVELASSCATNCDTLEAVLNLCLRHSQISGTNYDTVEAVLYLCLRHSLRMHDLELAQGCEEALQQLETVKRPLLRDLLRVVYNPRSHRNRDTRRKFRNWWNRRSFKLASFCARNWDTNCDTVEAVLYLCLRHSHCKHNLEAARGCEEALQQLETVKRPLLRDLLRVVYNPRSHQNRDTQRNFGKWLNRRSFKLASSCARNWGTNWDTVEAVLYLCLRHSLRMHDLQLARNCEKALQLLEPETVKGPLPRDVLRLVYQQPSYQNPSTLRRSAIGGIVVLLNWSHPAPEIVPQMYTEV